MPEVIEGYGDMEEFICDDSIDSWTLSCNGEPAIATMTMPVVDEDNGFVSVGRLKYRVYISDIIGYKIVRYKHADIFQCDYSICVIDVKEGWRGYE